MLMNQYLPIQHHQYILYMMHVHVVAFQHYFTQEKIILD